ISLSQLFQANQNQMVTMADDDQSECPLCMEPLDFDDLAFYPCPCEYQICRFCWTKILDEGNGLCPACRNAYNSEQPASFKPLTEEEIMKIRRTKKMKEQARKQQQKTTDNVNKRSLNEVRVVQHNLVFVIGLPARLADADVLRGAEYFGKYGRVYKIALSRPTNVGGGGSNSQASFGAYVTFYKSEDAIRALLDLRNTEIDRRMLKASLGTTKYCSSYLKGHTCPKPDCMYLHELGDPNASFTKEEMNAGKHNEFEERLVQQFLSNQKKSSANHNQKQAANAAAAASGTSSSGAGAAASGGGGGGGATSSKSSKKASKKAAAAAAAAACGGSNGGEKTGKQQQQAPHPQPRHVSSSTQDTSQAHRHQQQQSQRTRGESPVSAGSTAIAPPSSSSVTSSVAVVSESATTVSSSMQHLPHQIFGGIGGGLGGYSFNGAASLGSIVPAPLPSSHAASPASPKHLSLAPAPPPPSTSLAVGSGSAAPGSSSSPSSLRVGATAAPAPATAFSCDDLDFDPFSESQRGLSECLQYEQQQKAMHQQHHQAPPGFYQHHQPGLSSPQHQNHLQQQHQQVSRVPASSSTLAPPPGLFHLQQQQQQPSLETDVRHLAQTLRSLFPNANISYEGQAASNNQSALFAPGAGSPASAAPTSMFGYIGSGRPPQSLSSAVGGGHRFVPSASSPMSGTGVISSPVAASKASALNPLPPPGLWSDPAIVSSHQRLQQEQQQQQQQQLFGGSSSSGSSFYSSNGGGGGVFGGSRLFGGLGGDPVWPRLSPFTIDDQSSQQQQQQPSTEHAASFFRTA
ncbi:hypothetical protein BOX15_Mlig002978g1, partial [Macrostomum lignano]